VNAGNATPNISKPPKRPKLLPYFLAIFAALSKVMGGTHLRIFFFLSTTDLPVVYTSDFKTA